MASFTALGATLVAETTGPGSGSATYVLLHGIGMGRSVFAELTNHLATAAHVIAIDLPGYGEAPEPPRTLTMERTADVVAAYLRSHGFGARAKRAVFVGHSMGTQVAAEVAVRHADVVAGLVLIGPTVDPRERTAVRQLLRLAQDLLLESPKVLVRGAREYLRAGPNLRLKMKAMLVHRPEAIYPRISAPTLVLRGEHDCVADPVWCRFVADSIPDARLEEVDGHGHEAMIRDAEPSARLIAQFTRQPV